MYLHLFIGIFFYFVNADSHYDRFKGGQGEVTMWSDNPTGGSCLLDPLDSPDNTYFVAMNSFALNNYGQNPAELCGACIRVYYQDKSVVVKIVNELPDAGRGPGDLDISLAAWQALTSDPPGILNNIGWLFELCPNRGALSYLWKSGSTAYWAGVQVRGYGGILTGLAVNYNNVARMPYNYFVGNSGFGNGPFSITTYYANGWNTTDYNVPLNG
eukprot:TRINITY_DN1012_c0_g1_i1.p1 TRINITY_DN1012_c0_g1~~TRINITY_DN1012_c0_g1_i1.p1  ORF type:complete len:214 (-),score=29.95 TRINITY_DN1012_c0_g1_i1:60-701(-)